MLYCAIFCKPSFWKFLKFFGTSIASLDPGTVDLLAFSILSAMFTEACGLPEQLSLALALHSNILCMIVSLTAVVKMWWSLCDVGTFTHRSSVPSTSYWSSRVFHHCVETGPSYTQFSSKGSLTLWQGLIVSEIVCLLCEWISIDL